MQSPATASIVRASMHLGDHPDGQMSVTYDYRSDAL